MKPASSANTPIASRSALSIASTRARTCSSSTPTTAFDCGVCEPECPVDAIKPATEALLDFWLDLNRTCPEIWPNITRKKPAPPDADAFVNVPDKYAKYFNPNPGEGD